MRLSSSKTVNPEARPACCAELCFWANRFGTFGMQQVGADKVYQSGSYRYGFNGKEKDDEIKGSTGTSYDYGERFYDPRLGRFQSPDPLEQSYPWQSTYVYAGNRPITSIDFMGMGEENATGSGVAKRKPLPEFKVPSSKSDSPSGNNVEPPIKTGVGTGSPTKAPSFEFKLAADESSSAGSDYSGIFVNATPEEREAYPFLAPLKDFGTDGLNTITPIGAIDNAIATFASADATVADYAVATVNLVLGGFMGRGPKSTPNRFGQIRSGIVKANQIAKTNHNIKLGDGKRMDLKGRHPLSKGHYNKVTKQQLGYPHVADPKAPGGVREPIADDYIEIHNQFKE